MTLSELQAVVLRMPGSEGNFRFRVGKLPRHQAELWEQELALGSEAANDLESLQSFGPPVDLSRAMELLDTRDFRVLDVGGYQFH